MTTHTQAESADLPHNHATADDNIRGALNPELIPDNTAYRLFFVTSNLKAQATQVEISAQQARLRATGLQGSDIAALSLVLADFSTRYTDLIKAYNDTVAESTTTSTSPPSYSDFLMRRDALVQSARDRLHQVLSSDGAAILDNHIRTEKEESLMQRLWLCCPGNEVPPRRMMLVQTCCRPMRRVFCDKIPCGSRTK